MHPLARRFTCGYTRVTRRVGHRGASLLLLGFFDEIYALSIPSAGSTGTATSRWLAYVAPLPLWASIWAAVGIVLIAGAFMLRDNFAFFAAVLLKLMWSMFYLLGWLLHGVYRGWVSAAVWGVFALWVLVVSTWPERQWPAG